MRQPPWEGGKAGEMEENWCLVRTDLVAYEISSLLVGG